jgi:hypothetical protein
VAGIRQECLLCSRACVVLIFIVNVRHPHPMATWGARSAPARPCVCGPHFHQYICTTPTPLGHFGVPRSAPALPFVCAMLICSFLGWFWLLPAALGCSWLLLGAPGCSWLLLAAPGCSWLLLAAPGCSWLLLAAPSCLWLSLAAAGQSVCYGCQQLS